MVEQRELFNKDLKPTGIYYAAGEQIPDGYYDLVVMIAIENCKGKFLMQKRSKSKGGGLAVTGGHPKANETALCGIILEVKEELGISIENYEIKQFWTGITGKHIRTMFYVKIDDKIKNIKLQKSEVQKIKWLDVSKIRKLISKNKLSHNQVDFYTKLFEYLKK